jgi:glutathione peroxidase
LYKYLKKELKGKLNDNVKWNFTKFLINKNGEPSQRFSSTVEPEDIKPFIDNLI